VLTIHGLENHHEIRIPIICVPYIPIVLAISFVLVDFMAVKHIQSNPRFMLSVWSSLQGRRGGLQEPRSDKEAEYNGVTTVVLWLVLIRIDESCNESSAVGDGELQSSCCRPLVMPRAVV
jgi:hypothetical protein